MKSFCFGFWNFTKQQRFSWFEVDVDELIEDANPMLAESEAYACPFWMPAVVRSPGPSSQRLSRVLPSAMGTVSTENSLNSATSPRRVPLLESLGTASTFHERSPRPSASMVACSSRPGSPLRLKFHFPATVPWSVKVTVSTDTVQGAFLNNHAGVDVELTLFVNSPDDVTYHGSASGSPSSRRRCSDLLNTMDWRA